MDSKKDIVLELIFGSSRHWRFKDLLTESKLSRGRLNYHLVQLSKEGIVKRTKDPGKMPTYCGNFIHPAYKNLKRLFMMNKLYDSGFLNHLQSLPAKTVIIFGSIARSDWYRESDIDLFIYGSSEELNLGEYERKLKREIQLFTAKSKSDVTKLGPLMNSIADGYLVKGSLTETANA